MPEKKKMQKVVYLSNTKDFTMQKNISENRHFKNLNEWLDKGWTVAQPINGMTVNNATMNDDAEMAETFAAFVVLEKDAE